MSWLFDIAKEYEKDKKLKKENVENLRLWTEKQPHLPKINEQQLILFLRNSNYNNEKAKISIENFFTIRTIWKEVFCAINPKDLNIQLALDTVFATFLPGVCPNGYRIGILKFLNKDPERYNFIDNANILEKVFSNDMYAHGPCDGYQIVCDGKGAKFSHVLRIQPRELKQAFFYVEKAVPVKFKLIHIVNPTPSLAKILVFLKHFLPKELYDSIRIHNTMDSLYEFVPKDLLPEEYGGKAGTFKELTERNRQMLEEKFEFFEELEKQITDETKRVRKSSDVDQIFGLEGTFKMLDID